MGSKSMEIYFDESGQEHEKPTNIEPEWRIGGYVVIQNNERKLLMVQPTWNNFWELPGGGINKDETLREGVARECYEETGYKIQVGQQPLYIGERNTNRGEKRWYKSIIFIYAGGLLSDERDTELLNQEMDEISKVEWVDIKTLSGENTQPVVWPAIKKMQE